MGTLNANNNNNKLDWSNCPLIQTQLNMSSLLAQWPYSQEPVHSSLVNLEER